MDPIESVLAAGVRLCCTEPINDYDFPEHAVVIIAHDDPQTFGNLDKYLNASDHIFLCEFPVMPRSDVLIAAAQHGRVVWINAASVDSATAWWNFCEPYRDRLLAAGVQRRLYA